MPGLRILCLHGQGSNNEIMKTQMGPLRNMLAQTGVATLEWFEGAIPTEAGPGVSGMFEGPYYQYFSWPPTASEDDEISIREACEDLEDHIEENGPYDAILGFSQGSTFLAEFLCDYARRRSADPLPCRCAIFMNGIPPYRMDEHNEPIPDSELLEHFPAIPTLHVIGKNDFVYKYSVILHASTNAYPATLITHEKGHEMSTDRRILQKITTALEQVSNSVALGH